MMMILPAGNLHSLCQNAYFGMSYLKTKIELISIVLIHVDIFSSLPLIFFEKGRYFTFEGRSEISLSNRTTSLKLHFFHILENCAPLELCVPSKVQQAAHHANLKVSCLEVMVIRSIGFKARPQSEDISQEFLNFRGGSTLESVHCALQPALLIAVTQQQRHL